MALFAKPTKGVFPFFNKPLFIFHELCKLTARLTSLQRDSTFSEQDQIHLQQLHTMLARITMDADLKVIAHQLQFYQSKFQSLCQLLEPNRFDSSEKVKNRVQLFGEHLKLDYRGYPDLVKVERRLQKYWDILFTAYDVPGLPRVNNNVEHFHLALKNMPRRQHGRRDNWLFIEHYGELAPFLFNFLSRKDPIQRPPLEQLGINVQAEILRTFQIIAKSKMKTLVSEIKEKFRYHRFILKILKEGVDWIFQEVPETPAIIA